MPAQTTEEVKKDLVTFFSEKIKASKFYDDYAAIASFLSDPRQYGPALRKLDTEMEELYVHRLARTFPKHDVPKLYAQKDLKNDFKYLQGAYKNSALSAPRKTWDADLVEAEKAIQQFKKLLTDTLAINEERHGFRIAADNPATDIIVGLPRGFNDLLRSKRPFKDIGAGHEHGEYSHRIQWYLITQMDSLKTGAATIYEKLPGWSTKYTEYTSPRNFYMWEFLVDRDGVPSNAAVIPFKTLEILDFRAPSNVNRWLCDMAQSTTYSWLHSSLKRRWDKRSAENLVLYVGKKLLKKNFQNMRDIDDSDFEKIQGMITGDAIIQRT